MNIHPVVEAALNKKERSDKGGRRPKYNMSLPLQYRRYLARANQKGMAFEIPLDVFNRLCSMNCSYCGGSATGLDRVDSSEGYVEYNVVPCCALCNTMKFNHSTDKFLSHIDKIYKYQQNKS